MAYTKEYWEDHSEGEVTQDGTPLDASHFNHMELGIKVANKQEVCFKYDDDGYLCYEPAEDVGKAEAYYPPDEDGGDDG